MHLDGELVLVLGLFDHLIEKQIDLRFEFFEGHERILHSASRNASFDFDHNAAATSMPQTITILSGTRDELGGVELGIANVYERKERPGTLSAQLVLPDGEILIAPGDELSLGGSAFRLDAITPHTTGGHDFTFTRIAPEPEPPKTRESVAHPIPVVSPDDLYRRLHTISDEILRLLAPDKDLPPISGWTKTSTEETFTEWNGARSGPSTHYRAVASFKGEVDEGTEATLRLDLIRYDPNEIYRHEISGSWSVDGQRLHIFLRAETGEDFTEVWSSNLPAHLHALIAGKADT